LKLESRRRGTSRSFLDESDRSGWERVVVLTSRWNWIGLGTLTALVATSVACGLRPAKPVDFPADGEIVWVTASLTGDGFQPTSPLPEFAVPPAYVPRLMAAFRPTERLDDAPNPGKLPVMGALEITARDGRRLTVTFCDTGKT